MDREKVIKGLELLYDRLLDAAKRDSIAMLDALMVENAVALLKEQETQKFLADESGKITPLPVVVRCKDCIHMGKSEKCVLAAISEEKNFPLFMLDNRGEWFCADGKRKPTQTNAKNNALDVR